MKAIDLECEYLKDPLGIDIKRPRLFWKDEGGLFQKGFRLLYRLNGGDWTKEERESSSMHVDFPSELHSRDYVEWKVQLEDEKGTWGEESQVAAFELGLLSSEDWKAKWITGNYSPKKSRRYPVDGFQKKFLVTSFTKARLYLTALGLYEAYLNGKKVGEEVLTPGSTDYHKRVQYQTFDVTSLLHPGENTLEILLADGWYRGSIGAKGRTCIFGKATALLSQLEITEKDGSRDYVFSDRSFSWGNDGPIRFADLKDGEVYDANRVMTYPYHAKETSYSGLLSASDDVPLTENETFRPVAVKKVAKNRYVLSFSQNLAGVLAFSLDAHKGQKIDIVMGEMCENGEVTLRNIQCTHKGKKTPLQEIHYICKEGRNDFHGQFFYSGFRYAEVTTDVPLKKEDFTQIAIYNRLKETSSFESSNALITTFYHSTLWSLKSNSISVPTDCPTRERMGWTGDSQVFFPTASTLTEYAPFARKHLRDVFDRQGKSGRLPQIAPFNAEDWYMAPMNGSSGWADVGILMPYVFYQKYGDERILLEHFEGMLRYADFLMKRQGKWGGVYAKPMHLKPKYARYAVNRGQSYGEWAEPLDVSAFHWYDFASPHPEVSTAYTYYSLNLLTKIFDILHKDHDETYQKIRKHAEGAKRAYQALRKTKRFPLDTDRQANLVRPLYMGLLDKEDEEYAKKRLLLALEHYRYRLGTGFLSTPFIMDVLSSYDVDAAYRLLENEECPGWLFMAKHSTGTIWEGWEGTEADKGIASLNHYSKGALTDWLFHGMCGISLAKENTFSLAPVIGGKETFAEASYDSIYGKISLRWEKIKDGVRFTISVPANTKALFQYQGEKKELDPGRYDFIL